MDIRFQNQEKQTSRIKVVRRGIDAEELATCKLFSDLAPNEVRRLARHFDELAVAEDEDIFRGGDPSEAFYVISEGAVVVSRDIVGRPVQLLARLFAGDFFGELGLLGNIRRTSAVRTTEGSRIFKIAKSDLLDFLDGHPEIRSKLQSAATERQSKNVAAAIELGRRREVRLRLDHPVHIEMSNGVVVEAILENMSPGGMCLSQAPASWQVGDTVPFGLGLREGVLQLTGHVAWRRHDRLGMQFEKRTQNHDMLIQLTIRMLLATAA